jgi:hypothetical protein
MFGSDVYTIWAAGNGFPKLKVCGRRQAHRHVAAG